MKKYLFVFKSEVMSNLQYIFNIFVGFIGYFLMLFIFLNLWQYIYSDPNEIINGYTMSQMIWYVIITELLWMCLGGKKLCNQICNSVKSGNIAYILNKPYNYILYCISSHLGTISIKTVAQTIFAMFFGLIFLGSFPTLNFFSILAVILTSIFAFVISILLITCIGLLSFFIEDANPFYWLYSKFILVIGTLFPIEYFPTSILPFLKYSPIYVVSYGPAKLFVDFSLENFISIITAQVIYIIFGYLLCTFIYKKGVKRLNVNGG